MILSVSFKSVKKADSFVELISEDYPIETINIESEEKALVNYSYFKELVLEIENYRPARLISLDTFLVKARNPKTVILDTRSKEMYNLKHVKGAIHLNFSEFTKPELDKLFANFNGENTEILIYCNNNFYDSKALFSLSSIPTEYLLQDKAFMSKSVSPVNFKFENAKLTFDNSKSLALNIPTFINLYGYGFKNIYELNELVDVNDPRIAFEGTFNDQVK
ncbi:MAG: rhodanese-like domain-containing protein [Flavobacteriales bacterium]|nr:rhodanese-like domain-containing protein [Flavobacteriales bacterium]